MSCNDTRPYQPDGKLFQDCTTATTATSVTTPARPANSGKVRRKFRFCFKFFAFVFSHVGLGFLVLVYTILGAFMFKHFEESASAIPYRNTASEIADIRNTTVNKLWTETYKLNVLYKENWTVMAIKEIEHFQRVLIDAIKNGHPTDLEPSGGPARQLNPPPARWSFADSWMYSISIITTIGYANRPATSEGKIATIFYALFGIPIMLLFLSTIGNLLGRGLKFLYRFCCTCSNGSQQSALIGLQPSSSTHDHHHHLHEDYQVHHIALNNINSCSHRLACNQSLANNTSTTNPAAIYLGSKNPTFSTFNPHPCSCELETEAKLCVDPIDHLCSDKLTTTYGGHSHLCGTTSTPTVTFDLEPSTFQDYKAHHSHPSLQPTIYGAATTTTTAEEDGGPRENVPLYFCFFLITIYIFWGAFMFYIWEGWSLLDGAYFCFVTLSTIGFGDLIPEKTLSLSQTESKKRIILIVLYILGGMTLIAMSFNIIYEQLAYKFRNFGNRFSLNHHPNRHDRDDIKIVSNKFVDNIDV